VITHNLLKKETVSESFSVIILSVKQTGPISE
jgi:hypothetical protein